MNEFDDLFDNNEKKNDKEKDLFDQVFEKRNKENMDGFQRDLQYQKHNGILFLIYIIVNIVFTFGGLMFFTAVYPDTAEIGDNINFVSGPEFIYEYDDDDNIIATYFDVEIINENTRVIKQAMIRVDVYNSYDYLYDSFDFYYDDFEPEQVVTIHQELNPGFNAHSYEVSYQFDLSPMFYIVLGFLQAFVAGIIFLIVDRVSFKKDFVEFRRSPGKFIGQIILGFFIVFGALLLSSMILSVIGVTDTSQNEATIRGFFEKDALRLIILFFMLCVFTPIVEEVVFRKVVYNFIEPKTNSVVAIIGTGVVFGLMHVITYGDFIQSIPYILMGITFGYIYYRSKKNLLVTIGVHFLNNFVSYVMYVLVLYGYYTI